MTTDRGEEAGAGAPSGRGRDESEEERLDRKWNDLLQELRVMQTSAQLTAGFLLTLPFQSRFADLTTFQRVLYLVLVLLAAVTTSLIMGAVAVHRRLSGAHVKERVVASGHRIVQAVTGSLTLLILGIVVLIFDVVVSRTVALVVAAVMCVWLFALLVVLPRRLFRERA